MCNTHVIQDVKNKMLSRRGLLRSAAVTTVAASTAATFSWPAKAERTGSVHDLTHELHENFPNFFGEQKLFVTELFNFKDNGFNMKEFRFIEHIGTHMDAPLHFSSDGQSVAEIPVRNLVVPLCILDFRAQADNNPDAQVAPEDIKAWTAKHGPIPDNACVAMNSGWERYLNESKFRNPDDKGVLHFPGFHPDAAQMLMEETTAIGIAVDTLSIDHGASPDFATHYLWLPTNRWGLECVAGLSNLPAQGATLVVGAPKNRGGTGGPSRVLALV